MKKFIAIFLIILIATSSFTTIGIFAEKPITVILNGSLVEFDVPPQIIDDRTMVPIRKICEVLGMKVDFEDSTRKITITDSTGFKIINILGNKKFELIDNGISKMVESDVPTLTVYDRTMIPARFLSELVNMYVKWDGVNSQVIITSDFPGNGNTNGNFSANEGQFSFDGGYIYYCDGHHLYKTKEDGTEKLKIDDGYVTSINIVGDWLYYVSDDKVIKIKKDGTQRTTLSWIDASQDCMVISNNVMYYADAWGGLFRVNLDGTNTTRMGDIVTFDFQIDGDWIYYVSKKWPYEYIHRISIDGTKQEIILDSSCDNFVVSNGWIYYTNTSRDGGKGLFKIRCNGSGKQLLKNSTEICELNYCNGWIYFKEKNNDNFRLKSIDTAGNNEKVVKSFDGLYFFTDIGISDTLMTSIGYDENVLRTYDLTNADEANVLLTVNSDEYKKTETITSSEKFDETTSSSSPLDENELRMHILSLGWSVYPDYPVPDYGYITGQRRNYTALSADLWYIYDNYLYPDDVDNDVKTYCKVLELCGFEFESESELSEYAVIQTAGITYRYKNTPLRVHIIRQVWNRTASKEYTVRVYPFYGDY